jgi:hypothetical protein
MPRLLHRFDVAIGFLLWSVFELLDGTLEGARNIYMGANSTCHLYVIPRDRISLADTLADISGQPAFYILVGQEAGGKPRLISDRLRISPTAKTTISRKRTGGTLHWCSSRTIIRSMGMM